MGDLAGREAFLQESLDLASQPRAGHELGRFRASGQVPSSSVSSEGPVVRPAAVVGHLARDRRGRPTRSGRDLGQREALGQAPRDLLAFFERQHPFGAHPGPRTHTARCGFDQTNRRDSHAEGSCDGGAVKASTEQSPDPVLRCLVHGSSSCIRREPLQSPLEFADDQPPKADTTANSRFSSRIVNRSRSVVRRRSSPRLA